jgi:hypothetical protein
MPMRLTTIRRLYSGAIRPILDIVATVSLKFRVGCTWCGTAPVLLWQPIVLILSILSVVVLVAVIPGAAVVTVSSSALVPSEISVARPLLRMVVSIYANTTNAVSSSRLTRP